MEPLSSPHLRVRDRTLLIGWAAPKAWGPQLCFEFWRFEARTLY